MGIRQEMRVRITAPGEFHNWEAVVQPFRGRKRHHGVWVLVPGHPWQEKLPNQLWHFNDNEVEDSELNKIALD
jgi:hypothetical protein